jgi:hypothetical protein
MRPREQLELARVTRHAGASTDAILAALRVDGSTAAESVRVLRDLYGVRLGAAKGILDRSPVWGDMADVNEAIRRLAARSIELDS